MKRRYLYAVAAVVWGIPGIILSHKGISAYVSQPSENLWWLLLITSVVLFSFFLMFRKIVDRYSDRIASLPDIVRIWQVFPPRGWALLVFMISLGFVMKSVPEIPSAFNASFYSGLGPMLLLSSLRFASGLKTE